MCLQTYNIQMYILRTHNWCFAVEIASAFLMSGNKVSTAKIQKCDQQLSPRWPPHWCTKTSLAVRFDTKQPTKQSPEKLAQTIVRASDQDQHSLNAVECYACWKQTWINRKRLLASRDNQISIGVQRHRQRGLEDREAGYIFVLNFL